MFTNGVCGSSQIASEPRKRQLLRIDLPLQIAAFVVVARIAADRAVFELGGSLTIYSLRADVRSRISLVFDFAVVLSRDRGAWSCHRVQRSVD
jgi:hypothetical protein